MLLLAALLMAGQPLTAALALALRAIDPAIELGIVICTAHGAQAADVDADRGRQAPQPRQKAPDCPYCTLLSHWGSTKAFLGDGASNPHPRLDAIIDIDHPVVAREEAPRRLLRLLTSPPRAPPLRA